MANPAFITSQSMPKQLAKEIDEMYVTTLTEIDPEWSKVLKSETAPAGRSFYQAEFVGLGLGKEIGEAESVPYDTPVEGNPQIYGYKQYGFGYGVTDLMLKDDYHGKIKTLPASLAKSQNTLIELEAMKYYNEAEGTTVNRVKDGKALCSATGHALLKPTIPFQQAGVTAAANTLYNVPNTAGDLSETTLNEAFEYYDFMVDEKGVPMMMTPGILMVSKKDQYIAHRLLTQEDGSSIETAGLGASPYDKNKNFANPSNGFIKPWSVISLRYMDDDRWFFNAIDHDNKILWKERPNQESMYDHDSRTTRYSSVMRFGLKGYEYRGTYGNIAGNDRTA